MQKIKEVKIMPGCVSCGTCAAVCPDVFKMDSVSEVKKHADLQKYQDCITVAADMCPVKVIGVEWHETQGDD